MSRDHLICLSLVIATAVVYGQVITFDFINFDDPSYVTENPHVTGGLSGPAIRPVAVRMAHQVTQAVPLPIIGMGGIMTAEDAVEFLLAGATAVAVGTANFVNPQASIEIIEGIAAYLRNRQMESVREIIGKVRV